MSTLIIVILVPLALAFVVFGLRDPIRIALPAYTLVVPFGSGISVFGRGLGSLSSLLGIVLAVGLVIQLVTTRRGSVSLPSAVPAWLALLALTGVTVFWSLDPAASAAGFANFASLVLLYVLVALIRLERSELNWFENAVLLGGLASSCYGLAQLVFFGGFALSAGGSARFGSDLLGANNQAAALLLPLAVALGRLVARSGRQRAGYAVVVALLILGIVMTGSRGGLLAMAATFAVCALASRQGRRLLLGTCIAGLALVIGLVVLQPGGIGARTVDHSTSSGRSEIWSIALYSCETYCLRGAGWEMFPKVYEQNQAYVPEARVLVQGTSYQAHDIWILAAVELGVLGLILLLLGLGLTVRSCLRLPDRFRGPPLAAVVGTAFSGFFLSNLEFKFWWVALMYAVAVQNFAAGDQESLSAASTSAASTPAASTPSASTPSASTPSPSTRNLLGASKTGA